MKNTNYVITIIILLIAVVALALTAFSSSSPLEGVVERYSKQYPDSMLRVERATGERAASAAQEIRGYCQGFALENFYLAEISGSGRSLVFVINPVTGATECMIDRNTNLNASRAALARNLLATVNSEPIYAEEVLAVFNSLPEGLRNQEGMQLSLDQVVNNKLLVQEAFSLGVNVSESEVDSAVAGLLASTSLTLPALEQNLRSSGSSLTEFREGVRRNLVLQRRVAEIVKDVPVASESEARAYFDNNSSSIMMLEKGQARQVMVYANQTNSEERLEYVKSIGNMYNGSNFCDLVARYSEDTATKDRCGLYNFTRGDLLPEFEDAVLSSQPGSVKIVASRLGYHIISVESTQAARNVTFEESRESIVNYLTLANRQSVLSRHLEALKANASIVTYQ